MNVFTKWKDKATQYVDVRLQLIKLGFIERASHVLGTLISMFIMLFLGFGFFIFLGISLLEFFVSILDGNRVGGALLTAAFFGILLGIIVLVRKSIINSFAGIFIKIMTDVGDDDDDPEEHRNVPVKGEDDE